MADTLEYRLSDQGLPATSIHGDRTQREREDALASFRAGRTPVLVATDVAARGLDIPNVVHVINYDFPGDIDDYVHRIGRTGRAGHNGLATSFLNDRSNSKAVQDLAEIFAESGIERPRWLEALASSGRFGGSGNRRGGGGRQGGGGRFGARDARSDRDGGGGYGGGGYGGGGYGGGYGGAPAPGGYGGAPGAPGGYGGMPANGGGMPSNGGGYGGAPPNGMGGYPGGASMGMPSNGGGYPGAGMPADGGAPGGAPPGGQPAGW